MKYEILEHPAELRIRVFGKILEELFSNAVLAMSEILCRDKETLKQARPERGRRVQDDRGKENLEIQSIDINSLLVDFLSEILARIQIKKKVYKVYKFISFKSANDGASLEAELIGHPVDHFDEDIKAITYEDLDIKQVDSIWQTVIVFDI